jgi:DNA processing protein
MLLPVKPAPVSPRIENLTAEEKLIYEAIRDSETSIDELVNKTRLPSSTVSSTLLALEMRRLVKQLPGQYFVKLL